ncbi:MFS transporter [Ramlibacter sp. AW1]|uniref:MFS transporter n=1 Tax=Ramlibacter aurantiacus TaxID=2801330 RepID=A0A936ZS79_9BURK|nr:MFS transporter [Ramlibacter aurantiacus]MBL0419669.1 MFS transporter [Ramlibacter aurantiacus]
MPDLAPSPTDTRTPQPQAQLAAVVVITLGIALSVLDSTLLMLALPDIARDFRVDAHATIWVVNAYQLAALCLLLPCAQIGDRIGYRRVYLAGVAVYTVGSVASWAAPSLPWLVGARAFQGLGSAGMMAVNAALIRLSFPASRLGAAMALNSVVIAVASVAGPGIAAAVLAFAPWHWLFAIQAPLGLVVLLLGWKSLPANTHPPAKGNLSMLDVLLNVLMFALLFLATYELGTRSGDGMAGKGVGAALLAAGAVVATVFVRRQRRLALPLLPVDLLRIRVFRLSMCTSVAAFAGQTSAFVALPFLLLESQGRSHLAAGALLTAWPAATIVFAPLSARLMTRHPAGVVSGIGLVTLATGLALLALLDPQAAPTQVAWRLAVCGAGFGLFQSPNNHTIVTSAPIDRSGAAGGMLGTARMTGMSLGAILTGLVFSAVGVKAGPGPAIALAAASVLSAMAAVFSLLRTRPS